MYQKRSFLSNIPPVVKNLLIINLLAYFATYLLSNGINLPILGFTRIELSTYFGLFTPGSNHFYFFQYFTYMFMHANFEHVFFNMFALFMFGQVLERFWGSQKFLFFYLATGIGAALLYALVAYIRVRFLLPQIPQELIANVYEDGLSIIREFKQFKNPAAESLNRLINIPTVGASGAVFGILLAFGMLFPEERIYLYMIVPIKAKWFVIGIGAVEFFFTVLNQAGDNVAHLAHLGGMIIGFILIRFWRRKQF